MSLLRLFSKSLVVLRIILKHSACLKPTNIQFIYFCENIIELKLLIGTNVFMMVKEEVKWGRRYWILCYAERNNDYQKEDQNKKVIDLSFIRCLDKYNVYRKAV